MNIDQLREQLTAGNALPDKVRRPRRDEAARFHRFHRFPASRRASSLEDSRARSPLRFFSVSSRSAGHAAAAALTSGVVINAFSGGYVGKNGGNGLAYDMSDAQLRYLATGGDGGGGPGLLR